MRPPANEDGSAAAEFVLVSVLLVALVLGVVQLGLVMLVRNTALDAAAEGARWAALAGNGPSDGVARARAELRTALGTGYAHDVTAVTTSAGGVPVVEVVVRAPLPVVGLYGVPAALRLAGHAPVEPAP